MKLAGKGGRDPTPPAELAALTGRERVYVFEYGDEEGLATVLRRGEEMSTVRYDRADLFGKEGHVLNRQLKPVLEKKPKKAKQNGDQGHTEPT
jgi:hypothetical protein